MIPKSGKRFRRRSCAKQKLALALLRESKMLRREFLAATPSVIGLGLTPAAAQTYPDKPIKMIVPYTPGSPVDVLCRVVTQQLSVRLGQTIVLDNRPGAGTTIGTKIAADSPPDGYTLLIAATSFIISASLYPKLD